MTEVDMKAMMHRTFRMINLVYYFKDYSEIYRYIRQKITTRTAELTLEPKVILK
jgi:hypothetical protein